MAQPPEPAAKTGRLGQRRGTRTPLADVLETRSRRPEVADPYLATERQKHHGPAAATAMAPLPATATAPEKMRAKLRTARGRAVYGLRKGVVEPVFGRIKGARGFRRFSLRGLEKIRGEWRLVCLTHNLLKIWRYRCAPSIN